MHRLRLFVLIGTSAATLGTATSSCSSSDSASAGSSHAADGGVGEGGAVDAVAPPAGCDTTVDAKDSLPCASDAYALFVNVNAPPGGTGTKEAPLTSINAALGLVASSGKQRIYICGTSTYAEHVEVNAQNAARLIGGFDCTWNPVTNAPAQVEPLDVGYALKVDTVSAAFRIEDVSFTAQPGTAASPSSIAVFVANSANVTFERVTITAQDGSAGTDGKPGTTGMSTPADGTGNAATQTNGGAAKSCVCSTGGTSIGGKGGDIAGPGINGSAGAPIIAPPSLPNAGAGQAQGACNAGGVPAQSGSDAPAAADAVVPPVGALEASGWVAGDGPTGAAGGVGQGGGGGGSDTDANFGAGGGGGCGGCGGSGGTGGTAGGSSIALATFDSPVELVSCTLISGKGGDGGKGMPGGTPANGGAKGRAFEDGCEGGSGGTGGAGGAGAGGAGGISAAVLSSGSSATNSGSTLTPGGAGSGGTGGNAGHNDGPGGKQGTLLDAATL